MKVRHRFTCSISDSLSLILTEKSRPLDVGTTMRYREVRHQISFGNFWPWNSQNECLDVIFGNASDCFLEESFQSFLDPFQTISALISEKNWVWPECCQVSFEKCKMNISESIRHFLRIFSENLSSENKKTEELSLMQGSSLSCFPTTFQRSSST